MKNRALRSRRRAHWSQIATRKADGLRCPPAHGTRSHRRSAEAPFSGVLTTIRLADPPGYRKVHDGPRPSQDAPGPRLVVQACERIVPHGAAQGRNRAPLTLSLTRGFRALRGEPWVTAPDSSGRRSVPLNPGVEQEPQSIVLEVS